MRRLFDTVAIVAGNRELSGSVQSGVVRVLFSDGTLPDDEPGKIFARVGDADGADHNRVSS